MGKRKYIDYEDDETVLPLGGDRRPIRAGYYTALQRDNDHRTKRSHHKQ